jgi:hypothetical protein
MREGIQEVLSAAISPAARTPSAREVAGEENKRAAAPLPVLLPPRANSWLSRAGTDRLRIPASAPTPAAVSIVLVVPVISHLSLQQYALCRVARSRPARYQTGSESELLISGDFCMVEDGIAGVARRLAAV